MSIEEQKEVAYYSATLQAFSNSMFERNRQLLVISYLTVGLLFAFVQGLKEHLDILFWFVVQTVFVFNILVLFRVNILNCEYFACVLHSMKDEEDNREWVQPLENRINSASSFSFFLFLLGIFLAFVFAYSQLADSHLIKELFLYLKGLVL